MFLTLFDSIMFKELVEYFKAKERDWESLCIRCGGCCGAFDDPCTHLRKDENNKYFCPIYNNRFGEQVTVKGEKFTCVNIERILYARWKNDHLCPYRRHTRCGI